MKNLTFFLMVTIMMSLNHSACTQDNQSNESGASGLIVETVLRGQGTSFYALDSKTGQLHYMLDFSEVSGKWQPYGSTIRTGGGNPLLFQAVERAGITYFFSLNSQTGQLYYTNDSPEVGGEWKSYGPELRSNGLSLLKFSVTARPEGHSYYAFDGHEGQLYFMNDFGDDAGVWAKYGETL